jgi:hypothetical protein
MQLQQTLRFAGDVSVGKIRVTSQSGFFQDIANQVIGIQIFEDLLSPFITGTLIIKDSLDLVNLFPFVGEEYVELDIKTPTLRTGNISGKFYIYKMTDRELTGDKQVVYQLHFTSQDALLDLNKSVSKTFSGKISDIAKTLLIDKVNGMQVNKASIVEDTFNSTKYTSNFWSPVKNLLFLTKHAINKNKSPGYLFFENRDGYNFVSLEYLYKQKVSAEFTHDNYTRDERPLSGSVKNIQEDYKRIISIKIPTGIDYIDRITSGVYGSRLWTHDVTSKRFSSTNYDMLKDPRKQVRLNQYPAASKKVIYRYISSVMFKPKAYGTMDGFGDVTNTSILQERISLLKQAESTKIEIVVPGRCDYTVGRKVYVKLNKIEPTSKTDKKTLDNMFSGNYIISATNHFITKEKHETTLELIKDSLLVNLDKVR